MKRTATFLLFALGLFAGIDVWAQKPDLIYKTDSSIVQGYNVRVKGKVASFQVKPTRGAATQSISTQQIIKIVWANGRSEFFQLPFMQRHYIPLSVRLPNVQQRSLPPNLVQEKYVYDRYDRILTSDWKIIECVIQSVSDKEISYALAANEQGKKYTISRKLVREYEKNMSIEASPPPADDISTSEPVNQISSSGKYRYSSFIIGTEGSYILPNYSPQWGDDEIGLGLRQGVGGFVMYNRRLAKWFSAHAGSGYTQWEVSRLYQENGLTIYQSDQKLIRIPVQVGLRVYVYRGIYFSPQASFQLMSLTSTTSEAHYLPSLNETQSSYYAGYSGNLGVELSGKAIILDLGAGLTILPYMTESIVGYYPLTNRIVFANARIGIGFKKSRQQAAP